MTDCNANQLVVKPQVEDERSTLDQQVAVADQSMTIQTAPNAPKTGADQRARAQNTIGNQTPAVTVPSLPLAADASAVNPLHAVEQPAPLEGILRDLAEQNPAIQLEEQWLIQLSPTVCIPSPETSTAVASLSNLDRIGMGVCVTRTMRATAVPMEGEKPSTSGAPATQTISTHQEIQGLLTSCWEGTLRR